MRPGVKAAPQALSCQIGTAVKQREAIAVAAIGNNRVVEGNLAVFGSGGEEIRNRKTIANASGGWGEITTDSGVGQGDRLSTIGNSPPPRTS